MDAETTPRQTRLRLNKLERWFRANVERFVPEDRVFLRASFEYAVQAEDADVIADALRAGYEASAPKGDEPAPDTTTDRSPLAGADRNAHGGGRSPRPHRPRHPLPA